jgi:hypothetical protein
MKQPCTVTPSDTMPRDVALLLIAIGISVVISVAFLGYVLAHCPEKSRASALPARAAKASSHRPKPTLGLAIEQPRIHRCVEAENVT